MIEYNFYIYYDDIDKIKIYCEDISNYFIIKNIIVNSINFDDQKNVIVNIMEPIDDEISSFLEKTLLNEIHHLNDVEIQDMKIILKFDVSEIELS